MTNERITAMNNIILRNETENDYRAVENLTREAFWNVYHPGCDEHYFVHTMRSHEDFLPELAYVLESDGEILGNIMYTKSRLVSEDGEEKTILTFGPISVHPDHQRKGYGKRLIAHSCARAVELGYDTVVIFGNPANYVYSGFVSGKKKGISLEDGSFPTALLVKELVPGVLDGKPWRYIESRASECCADTEAVNAFDATFPPKEKAWRPSQEEFYIYSHSCVVR